MEYHTIKIREESYLKLKLMGKEEGRSIADIVDGLLAVPPNVIDCDRLLIDSTKMLEILIELRRAILAEE